MYFDGSLKLEGGGAGVLFISPKGEQLKFVLQILFEVSNNEAEYEAQQPAELTFEKSQALKICHTSTAHFSSQYKKQVRGGT